MKTSTKATILILLFVSVLILLISLAPKGNDMIEWEKDMKSIEHFNATGEKETN